MMESGWLVESSQPDLVPRWLKADGSLTSLAYDALRFARKQDAEAFLVVFLNAKFGDTSVGVYKRAHSGSFICTEHQWGLNS